MKPGTLGHGIRRLAALPPRLAFWPLAGALVAAAIVMVLMLLLPGKSVVTQHPWDLMTFIDAADRIVQGQVPNHDFHSPLGPLAYYLLALGYEWSGTLGGMMPVATALFVGLTLVPVVYTCLSRLPWWLALAFGLHILILSIAPFYIGDLQPKPTWGMFYNRMGWALLSLLFLFVLPRRAGIGKDARDAAAMAALWLILFYLKSSFAAMGGLFLVGLLWFPHARRPAGGALAASAITILLVELVWGATAHYIGDIRSAAAATGAVRGGVLGLFATIVNNIQGVYLLAAVLLIALVGRVRYDYLLFCLFMAGAGVLLDRLNAQGPGILTFIPAAVIAILAPRRDAAAAAETRPGLAAVLLAGALAIPGDVAAAGNLAFHFAAASTQVPDDFGGRMTGVITPDAPTSTPNQPGAKSLAGTTSHGCGPIAPAVLNLDARTGEHSLGPAQSLAFVDDGARLLLGDARLAGKVFVPDLANPLNALTRRAAPRGVAAFNDAEITFSESHHPAAEDMLRDVDVLMIPKFAQKYATFDLMRRLYRNYFDTNFVLVARSECWDAYRRKAPAVR